MMPIKIVASICVLGFIALAHTPQETNTVIEAALSRCAYYSSLDTEKAINAHANDNVNFMTWEGFLGGDANGWTLEEKRCAFDHYLSELGSCDIKNSRGHMDELYVFEAIKQCNLLNYTNSVESLKRLVLNTNGVHKVWALEVIMKFSAMDDATFQFVENIVTNAHDFTAQERVCALGCFSDRLCENTVVTSNKVRAARMIYANRNVGIRASYDCDKVAATFIEGYASSSNRLEYVNWILRDNSVIYGTARSHFTSITNQLLSSGRPLVQLDIGGAP